MKKVIEFLLGESDLDGYYFGESPKRKPFFWRTCLRAEWKKQQARIVELEQDNDVQHNLIMRQSEILTKTANALKGEPEELSLHSHHDLMDVAHKLVRERDALVATVERLREQLSAMAAQHQCGCGHPACNRCRDDADNREALRVTPSQLREQCDE